MTTTDNQPRQPEEFLKSNPERLFRVNDVIQHGTLISSSAPTGPWLERADGLVTGGALGVLVDDVLGYAVMVARPRGNWSVSSEISIDLCHPIRVGSTLSARAHSVHADERGGLASGEVVDDQGRLIAVARQHGRFIDMMPGEVSIPEIDVNQHGEANIFSLLDIETRVTGAAARLEIVAAPALLNPLGNLHGGITLCLADLVACTAFEAGTGAFQTSSIHVSYLRPIPLGTAMTFTATVSHAGRSFALATVDATNSAGKLCATATVTAGSR